LNVNWLDLSHNPGIGIQITHESFKGLTVEELNLSYSEVSDLEQQRRIRQELQATAPDARVLF